MMEVEIPSISNQAWAYAVEGGRDNVKKFFSEYVEAFDGNVPDERGLTDIFLLSLVQRNGVTMNIEKPSQAAEAKGGYDYAWHWKYQTADERWHEKIAYLQAKSYKPQGDGKWVADFTYRNSNDDYQLLLLNKTIEEARAREELKESGVVVIGGYLMYSKAGLQYLPIDSLKNDLIHWDGRTDGQINKDMSEFWYDETIGENDVQLIYGATK